MIQSSSITAEHINQYHQHGYALPGQQLFADEELASLTQTFERIQADWIARGGRPEHMDVPHFYYPELLHWLLHDQVLDVVEGLIGSDIALFSSHFVCKPSGNGMRVPWHEDSAYWGKLLDPMEVVTLWLAIDPSTPENGCMKVIPDSHHNGYSDDDIIEDKDAVFTGNIRKGQVDEERAVSCILKRGEYSLHHAKTIHGSARNTSPKRRCGYTMRYVSTASRFTPEHAYRPEHQIYLARGNDIAGNAYGDPTTVNKAWMNAYGFASPKGH